MTTKRTPLLVGNWKMHKSLAEARADFSAIAELGPKHKDKIQLGIAPVSLHLISLADIRSTHVGVYAQNVHWATSGAYTGEWSAEMLKDIHVQGAIVAHSERRQMNAESNARSGEKIAALLKQGLDVIYCVGETLEEREAGKLEAVLESQLREALATANLSSLPPYEEKFVIAYEPVWAIGTGKAATEKEAQEAHAFIRKTLAQLTTEDFASKVRILYGGSVKPDNIQAIMSQPDIDGALVGGASLSPDSFAALCTETGKSIC